MAAELLSVRGIHFLLSMVGKGLYDEINVA